MNLIEKHVMEIIDKLETFNKPSYIKAHAENNVFLLSTIAANMNSDIIRTRVLEYISNTNEMNFGLLISLDLLKADVCKTELIHIDQNISKMDGANFKDLVDIMCVSYLDRYTQHNILKSKHCPPSYVVKKAIDIMEERWVSFGDLRFDSKKFVRDRFTIYFLTHVLFIGNHYGTRPLNRMFPKQRQIKMYNVFKNWADQLFEGERNFEELCEICYSMFYLAASLGYDIPQNIICFFSKLLHTPLKKWRPGRYTPYTCGHGMLVGAIGLVEYNRFFSN
jgi:hypothetical protein